jgi:Holliday junction resolvasome RuvABC endonuclease subunit
MDDIKEQYKRAQAEKLKRVSEQIAAILRENECDLVAIPQFTPDGRVVAVVQLVEKAQ